MAATHSSPSMSPAFSQPQKTEPAESRLTKQLLPAPGSSGNPGPASADKNMLTEPHASPKSRSLSDAPRPALAPSPLSQDARPISKDDISLVSNPATPQKQHQPLKGLFLQMPSRRPSSPNSTPFDNSVPLSPKLDSSQTYGSPASVLPRRSRGLDFSRACTNLHHSTLAEASPDTSPTIGGRGMPIPPRKGNSNMQSWESPGNTFNQAWSMSGNNERMGISSSVSSVNMLDSDTSSSEDEDNEPFHMGDREDPMLTTPHVNRGRNGLSNPFSTGAMHSPGGEWRGSYSPAVASLMSFRRTRTKSGRSRHNSKGGTNLKPSPGPLSPSVMRSIESSNSGYFSKELASNEAQPRREHSNLGSSDIHLSDLSDDGESRLRQAGSPLNGATNPEGGHGVVRRPVTRRGNLLPKTKTFARVRAALFEEGAPVDCEAKLEAEVIRQVRESEPGLQASPSLQPSLPQASEADKIKSPADGAPGQGTLDSFRQQAVKNSAGVEFWNSFDNRNQTPPPSVRNPSQPGEDTIMETPPSTLTPMHDPGKNHWLPGSSTTTRLSRPSVVTDTSRKAHKRMRDEEFDPNSFKRRAVSPSVQSSPIMPQSPAMKEANPWGRSSKSTSGTSSADRSLGNDSGGNMGSFGSVKRVGLQGMNETNDGLMNMSIE